MPSRPSQFPHLASRRIIVLQYIVDRGKNVGEMRARERQTEEADKLIGLAHRELWRIPLTLGLGEDPDPKELLKVGGRTGRCANPNCHASEDAARELEQLGYTRVRIFPDGKEGWLDAGLELEQSTEAEAPLTMND